MFEDIAASVQQLWLYLVTWLQEFYHRASSINPSQSIALWLQIIVGCLTIVWIIFQFAWMRRLNEARLERYLEDRIATERDELAQERAETLAELDHVTRRRGFQYGVLLIWANIRLALSFVLRILSLGTVRGLADYTTLLIQVGMLRRARRIYSDIASDAVRKMKLYEDALANKRAEAQNALIFAGRIAVLENLPVAAVGSFKKATRLQDDPDARLLIGKQLVIAEDLDGALHEYGAALAHPSIGSKPSTKAELHRSVARILMRRNRTGLARQELAEAEALDGPPSDYLGLGETQELLGDLYSPKPRHRRAAEQAYKAAIANFERADDRHRAQAARSKLRELTGQSEPPADGWLTRAIDRWARALLRVVERWRARARRKVD